MSSPTSQETSFVSRMQAVISLKTIVLVIVFAGVVYVSYNFISKNRDNAYGNSANASTKIICKPNEKIIDGACVYQGPCGIRPTTNANCSADQLICDIDQGRNVWQCPLLCENVSNPLPSFLGSCSFDKIKCDQEGRYYCENDTDVCHGHGSFYGTVYPCKCNTDYYGGDGQGNQCIYKCPDGTYLYNNTCAPILPCINGSFSKLQNTCICQTGYYNKDNICKLIPNCQNGTYNFLTEKCDCPLGYGGLYCDINCGQGKYYLNNMCVSILNCVNGTFDLSQDKCICPSNFTGLLCDIGRANCSGNGNPLTTPSGTFGGCDCDTGYYGPRCADTKATMCNGIGVPQYDSNGNFTECICDNPNDGGKRCQYLSSDYCHSNGKVLTTLNDSFDKCSCNSGYEGIYCCLSSGKPATNSCLENSPLCTTNANNNGWMINPKQCSDITRLNSNGQWVYDPSRDSSCVVGTFDPSKNYYLSCADGINGSLPTITATRGCPKTLSCAQCGNTVSNSVAITGGTGEQKNYIPQVCVCDEGTNYENVCRDVQEVSSGYPDLCGNNQLPQRVHCDNVNSNYFLYHCLGYMPPASDQDYGPALKKCFETNKSISTNSNNIYYEYQPGGIPIYPAIDNTKCETNEATRYANDMPGDSTMPYWQMWNNPNANVMEDGSLVYRTDGGTSYSKYSDNDYLFYNGQRLNDSQAQPLQSLQSAITSGGTNAGCFTKKKNADGTINPAFLCSGHGTFKQTTLPSQDGTTTYKLNDGTCICDSGYLGNQCQFSSSANCYGYPISSIGTGKSVFTDYPQFTCDYSSIQNLSNYVILSSLPNDGDIIIFEYVDVKFSIINDYSIPTSCSPLGVFASSSDYNNLTYSLFHLLLKFKKIAADLLLI